jgi:hypothetical protein
MRHLSRGRATIDAFSRLCEPQGGGTELAPEDASTIE